MVREFDRSDTRNLSKWWRTVDRYMLGNIFLIIVAGAILIMSASPVVAESKGLHSFYFVHRQAIFLLLGIFVMLFISMMNVVTARRVAVVSFLGCVFLLLLVLIIGQEIKGATRWISLFGGFTLQPSEFIKPFFGIVTAWILARKSMSKNFPGFKISILLYIFIVSLLMLQPDFGMTIAISSVWAVQMFLAGLHLFWVIGIAVIGVVGVLLTYIFVPHVAHRIDSFFDPTAGDNYQVMQSMGAFINGGFFGVGPGQGVVKERIPDSHTDFIFAVVGEEFGILICILIIILFASFLLRGFYRLHDEDNVFVTYAVIGLLVQFAVQAIINIGVAISLIPNTGMTLPFISYGGSSILSVSITVGMILSFTRKRYG